MSTLGDIGELAAIERICRRLPVRGDIVVGAGDDCAVVRATADAPVELALTSDPVIEGVHFAPGTPPGQVGHKIAGRLLSDIAAMGGDPLWALIDVVAPPSAPADTIDRLYDGILALATRHGLAIAGGDTAAGPVLEVHGFAIGSVPAGKAILRSGAKPGDRIYVTGRLGGSILGRHLAFEPRVPQGRWLRGVATSMIDVSDGLASDLRHLVQMSGTGAELDLGSIPVSEAIAGRQGAVDHALFDGEDFELLFTAPADAETAWMSRWRDAFDLCCTRIGIMNGEPGVIRCRQPDGEVGLLERGGFQHFTGRA
jgi:thiamine-monophosphate kinase